MGRHCYLLRERERKTYSVTYKDFSHDKMTLREIYIANHTNYAKKEIKFIYKFLNK